MNTMTTRLVVFCGVLLTYGHCSAQYSLDSALAAFARSVPEVRSYTSPGEYCGGSGTHIGNGWILTARHVVEDGYRVTCVFGGQEVEAVQRFVSRNCDSALLKLERVPNVPAIPIRTGNLRHGETCYLAGYDPSGRYRWFDSRVGREVRCDRGGRNIVCAANRIGESARWGNSGGPVLDTGGRLIGNLHSSDNARHGGAETVAVHPAELCSFIQRTAQRYPDARTIFASAPAFPSQADSLSLQTPGMSLGLQGNCPGGQCPVPTPATPQTQAIPDLGLQLQQLQQQPVQPQAVAPCPPSPGEWVIPVPLTLRLRFVPQIGIGLGQ